MANIPLFDTHAHYDHPLYEGLGPEIVKQQKDAGILDGTVIPAISYESNFNREIFTPDKFPYVFFASGLHPKCANGEPV